ncbi:MAG: hypothetical protein ACRC3B_14355, partial [Bacteroidia bacterium]
AYDNILYDPQGNMVNPAGSVLDMIGNARNATNGQITVGNNQYNAGASFYPNCVIQLLNNYNKVSDHMPVVIEF